MRASPTSAAAALVVRRGERRDHLHDLVHDDRGRRSLILTKRRIAGAQDRGDPSPQRIAKRLSAFDDPGDRGRERDRGVPIRSLPELMVDEEVGELARRTSRRTRLDSSKRLGRPLGKPVEERLGQRLLGREELVEASRSPRARGGQRSRFSPDGRRPLPVQRKRGCVASINQAQRVLSPLALAAACRLEFRLTFMRGWAS